MLLPGRLCEFRRSNFFGSREILLRLVGVQSEIRFRRNALEGLLRKAIARCDHAFRAQVMSAGAKLGHRAPRERCSAAE